MSATPPTLECFFDCSSPWTYLAFTRLIPMAAELGVPISWRPILVGGVFNAVNQELYAARENMFRNERRTNYYLKDMADWAALCGLRIGLPDFHPVNSVKAMRGALFAAEQDRLIPYCRATFEAYWGDLRDISQDAVLRDIAATAGLDPEALLAATGDPRFKAQLRANTEELIARGGFGSPTLFINGDDMYFGNDRLPLVRHRLETLLAESGR
jgi:2-hydroxychromene-2-carboxylate isomerase